MQRNQKPTPEQKIAFERLIKTPEFKKWHKIQSARALGLAIDAEKWAERTNEAGKLTNRDKKRWPVVGNKTRRHSI